jgi:hypothetical protein
VNIAKAFQTLLSIIQSVAIIVALVFLLCIFPIVIIERVLQVALGDHRFDAPTGQFLHPRGGDAVKRQQKHLIGRVIKDHIGPINERLTRITR